MSRTAFISLNAYRGITDEFSGLIRFDVDAVYGKLILLFNEASEEAPDKFTRKISETKNELDVSTGDEGRKMILNRVIIELTRYLPCRSFTATRGQVKIEGFVCAWLVKVTLYGDFADELVLNVQQFLESIVAHKVEAVVATNE